MEFGSQNMVKLVSIAAGNVVLVRPVQTVFKTEMRPVLTVAVLLVDLAQRYVEMVF
jgi:hypothetical protein